METEKKGQIKANTQDILPIIKKWLYSEHDIFLRELISNGSDAITKRKVLSSKENLECPEGQIKVVLNKENKTIQIRDNGLGMSEEEVERYITQLAFSGAREFMDTMKKEGADKQEEIIGKFGLGFYSSFMVSDKVVIETLSYKPGAKAVHWESDGGTEYTIKDSQRSDVGTTITLHLTKESEEFLEEWKSKELIQKYCDFMPTPIFLERIKTTEELEKEAKEKAEKKEGEEEDVIEEVKALNDPNPLWKKDPTTITDDEYKAFYQRLFPYEQEPLFWIHLNVDHPFELKGILYFPKFNPTKPISENSIKLYSKQVFVSDNVKNIVPEFLSLLKGAIDSSDIPLNVSRSSLQGDPNIKKISNYIIKKVAESLKKLFQKEREQYLKVWEDISLFVKYGVISDEKFDDLMRDKVLLRTSKDDLLTMSEIEEKTPEQFKEKLKGKIVSFEKGKIDYALVKIFEANEVPVVIQDSYIDPHFAQHVEFKKQNDKEMKFVSGDNEIENLLESSATTEKDVMAKEVFEKILLDGKSEEDKKNFAIEIKGLAGQETPAYIKIDESSKKMQQMSKQFGQNMSFPLKKTLVINPSSKLVGTIVSLWDQDKKDLAKKLSCHLQELAAFSCGDLEEKEERQQFINRTQDLMSELSSLAL